VTNLDAKVRGRRREGDEPPPFGNMVAQYPTRATESLCAGLDLRRELGCSPHQVLELLHAPRGDTHDLRRLSRRCGIAQTLGEIVRRGFLDFGAKCPVRVYLADDSVKDEFTIQASAFYGDRDYLVMQVVVPDTERRFPGDPACAAPYSEITIYRKGLQ
jgi:Domain of unknown function (DUF4262)